jgi:hypothetical protein
MARTDQANISTRGHHGVPQCIRQRKNAENIIIGDMITKISVYPQVAIKRPAIKGKTALVRLNAPLRPAYMARLLSVLISSKMPSMKIL